MYRMLTTSAFILALGLSSGAVLADAKFTLSGEGGKDSTVFTANQMVRVNMIDENGLPEGYILFNNTTKKAIMVDVQQKRKMDMSEQAMESRAQQMQGYKSQMKGMMEQAMAGMTEQQKNMIQEKMNKGGMGGKGMGASAPPPEQHPKPRIVKSGSDKKGKFNCTKYDAFQGSIKTATACFASPSELGLSKADYKAVRGFFEHMRTMQEKAREMSGGFGGSDDGGDFLGDEAEGIPVYRKNLHNGEKYTITSVTGEKLNPKLFQEPDYPMMDMMPPANTQR